MLTLSLIIYAIVGIFFVVLFAFGLMHPETKGRIKGNLAGRMEKRAAALRSEDDVPYWLIHTLFIDILLWPLNIALHLIRKALCK